MTDAEQETKAAVDNEKQSTKVLVIKMGLHEQKRYTHKRPTRQIQKNQQKVVTLTSTKVLDRCQK